MNIFVDIDETICTGGYPYTDAQPIADRINKVNALYDAGHNITYWTGRGGHSGIDFTDLTTEQLDKWGCQYHDLIVGQKPTFDLYICDKSINSEVFFNYC